MDPDSYKLLWILTPTNCINMNASTFDFCPLQALGVEYI